MDIEFSEFWGGVFTSVTSGPPRPGLFPGLHPLSSLSGPTSTEEPVPWWDSPCLWGNLWPDKAGFSLIFLGDLGGLMKPGWGADELSIWGHDPMWHLEQDCKETVPPMPEPGATGWGPSFQNITGPGISHQPSCGRDPFTVSPEWLKKTCIY